MKTNIKWQLPVLAAATLLVAGCDPFPAKPEGSPTVVRITTYNGSVSNTVDHASADPAGTIATDMANPTDTVFVQFNKPMDGTSIEADTSGACIPATGYTFSANWDPATPDLTYWTQVPPPDPVATKFCYYPSSATDGAQIMIVPGAPLLFDEPYTVSGTVRDYQANSLPIDVAVAVDGEAVLSKVDGYTARISWSQARTPGTYTLEHSTDGGNTWTPLPVVVDTNYADHATAVLYCDLFDWSNNWYGDNTCRYTHTGLNPTTTHTYRLTEDTHTRPGAAQSVTLGAGRSISLYPVVPSGSTTANPGQIKAKWTGVTYATGYLLEVSPDGTTGWAAVPGYPGTGTSYTQTTGLTSGSTYYYRVTPTYTPAVAGLSPGPVAHMVAP